MLLFPPPSTTYHHPTHFSFLHWYSSKLKLWTLPALTIQKFLPPTSPQPISGMLPPLSFRWKCSFQSHCALQVVKSHWSVISLCFPWPGSTFNMIIISFPGYDRFTWFHTLLIFPFFAGLPFEFFLFWFFFFSLILKRLVLVFGPFLYLPLASQTVVLIPNQYISGSNNLPELKIHISNSLFDISMWLSNRPLKLNTRPKLKLLAFPFHSQRPLHPQPASFLLMAAPFLSCLGQKTWSNSFSWTPHPVCQEILLFLSLKCFQTPTTAPSSTAIPFVVAIMPLTWFPVVARFPAWILALPWQPGLNRSPEAFLKRPFRWYQLSAQNAAMFSYFRSLEGLKGPNLMPLQLCLSGIISDNPLLFSLHWPFFPSPQTQACSCLCASAPAVPLLQMLFPESHWGPCPSCLYIFEQILFYLNLTLTTLPKTATLPFLLQSAFSFSCIMYHTLIKYITYVYCKWAFHLKSRFFVFCIHWCIPRSHKNA